MLYFLIRSSNSVFKEGLLFALQYPLLSMQQYLDLLDHILRNGVEKGDRTGTGTLSCFGYQLRCNLAEGFPLLTTKRLSLRLILHELLWFIRGETNIKYLHENNVRIWDPWADEEGNLGPIYGYQWRNWNGEGIDQLVNVIEIIKHDPNSRRIVVTAWNPSVLPDPSRSFAENVARGKMSLAPCHTLFQFYVSKGKLSCQLYQRSADVFLGVPFNIASYALLTLMVAQVCDLEPGEFVHTFGDVHLYRNHIKQAKLQLTRTPRKLPTMLINKNVKRIDDFTKEDFQLLNYNPYPHIKAPISI